MAGCGCGKKKLNNPVVETVENLRSRGVSQKEILARATDGEDFIDAIYNGASYPHYIPSATGIISQYGFLNYGLGKQGDKIKVHKADFEKSNGKLYLPVPKEEGELEMANKGNEGIRGPEPINEKAFIAEYENNKRINAEAEKAQKAEARKVARVSKQAQAEQEETDTDLVELAKRSGEAENAQAIETGQANLSPKQEQLNTDDVNNDNVPDEQQRVNWNSKSTPKPDKKPTKKDE